MIIPFQFTVTDNGKAAAGSNPNPSTQAAAGGAQATGAASTAAAKSAKAGATGGKKRRWA